MKNSPALTRPTLLTMDPAELVMTHLYSWTQNVTNIHRQRETETLNTLKSI